MIHSLWHCPYREPEGCPWEWDDWLVVDPSIKEEVLQEHLDEEHPGWTIEELEHLKERRYEMQRMREGAIDGGPPK